MSRSQAEGVVSLRPSKSVASKATTTMPKEVDYKCRSAHRPRDLLVVGSSLCKSPGSCALSGLILRAGQLLTVGPSGGGSWSNADAFGAGSPKSASFAGSGPRWWQWEFWPCRQSCRQASRLRRLLTTALSPARLPDTSPSLRLSRPQGGTGPSPITATLKSCLLTNEDATLK